MSPGLLPIIYAITIWAVVSIAYWTGWWAWNRQQPPRGSYDAPRRRGSNPPPPGKKPRLPPNPTPTRAMNNPPLDDQNCDNCRYKRHRRGEDLCCINPPRLGDSGMMPICPVSRWCGEWVAR